MKKITTTLVALVLLGMGNFGFAEKKNSDRLHLAYDAGADIVSSYLWRGNYCGALSVQPDLAVGWDAKWTSFRVGTWWSLGSSDWLFSKSKGTYFVPELDMYANLSLLGVSVGVTHFYYFDGSPFFPSRDKEALIDDETTTATEVSAGVDLGFWLRSLPLYLNWNTTIAGGDLIPEEHISGTDTTYSYKRAFSSYLELGYKYEFDKIGLTIDANIGFSPWASLSIYGNDKFAVQCLSLKVDKEFCFEEVSINVFAQGMLNPSGINKENVFISAAGVEKLAQTLNATVGIGFWF